MRKDAAQNRQRLIEAARNVMWERGHDVPLEMITERAGITRGTLYHAFASSLQNNNSDLTQTCSPAALLSDVLAKPLAMNAKPMSLPVTRHTVWKISLRKSPGRPANLTAIKI